MHIDHRTPLRRAVDKLRADGIIKQDKDLQEMFNLSKSTISAYLSSAKPGKDFVIEFEKKFGISLKEFENGEIQFTTNYDKILIEALQGQVKSYQKIDDLEKRLDAIETNLNEALSNQKVMMATLTVAMNNAIDFYAEGNKKKVDDLKSKTRTEIAAATK